MEEMDEQQAAPGVVVDPGHHHRQGHVLENKKPQGNVVMKISGNPEQGDMPEAPD